MKSMELFKREYTGNRHWKTPCFLCNEWLIDKEPIYMIISNEKEIENFIVHKEEWDIFSKGLNEEDLYNKVLNYKKPRKKPLSKETLEEVENFKKACEEYGFNKSTLSKDKRYIRAGRTKTSYKIVYDIVFKHFSYETKSNEGLFGGLMALELLSKVENKFYELSNIDKHNDYSLKKVLNDATKEVDNLIKK